MRRSTSRVGHCGSFPLAEADRVSADAKRECNPEAPVFTSCARLRAASFGEGTEQTRPPDSFRHRRLRSTTISFRYLPPPALGVSNLSLAPFESGRAFGFVVVAGTLGWPGTGRAGFACWWTKWR